MKIVFIQRAWGLVLTHLAKTSMNKQTATVCAWESLQTFGKHHCHSTCFAAAASFTQESERGTCPCLPGPLGTWGGASRDWFIADAKGAFGEEIWCGMRSQTTFTWLLDIHTDTLHAVRRTFDKISVEMSWNVCISSNEVWEWKDLQVFCICILCHIDQSVEPEPQRWLGTDWDYVWGCPRDGGLYGFILVTRICKKMWCTWWVLVVFGCFSGNQGGNGKIIISRGPWGLTYLGYFQL